MDLMIVVSSLLFAGFFLFVLGAGLLLVRSVLNWAISPLQHRIKAQRRQRAQQIIQHSVTVEVD